MKKYESHRESGLFWLQSIPSHWKTEKIGRLFSQVKCKNFGMIETNLLSLSFGTVKRRNINATKGLLPENFEGYNIIESGDIALRLTDLQNDQKSLRTGLSKERGIITSAYITIRNRSDNSSEYLQMFLHVFDLAKGFYNVGASGVRQGLGWDDIKKFVIAVPPRPEQDQIVRFLDWKVSAINRLIAVKRKQITLLKEKEQAIIRDAVFHGIVNGIPQKESDLAWIGLIPKHWNITRIKYLFDMRDERNFKPLSEVNLISLYTSLGVVQNSDIEYKSGNKARNADNYKIVHVDDIIVNIILCWMGAVGRSNYDGVTSPAYDIYVPHENVCSRYYHYLFRQPSFSGECKKAGHGIMAMRWRTYSPEFRNIKVPEPPYEEQIRIANWLDSRSIVLDKRIKPLQDEIDVLHELRTRLISDVVTGQIDVRGIKIPDYEYVEEPVDFSDEDNEGTGDAFEDKEE